MLHRLVPLLILSLTSLPTLATTTGISSTTGDIEIIQTPPPSVQRQDYQSSSAIRIFQERQVSSPGPIPINALAPAIYHAYSDFDDVTITPNQPIRSYFIHLDPLGTDLVRLQGSITFDAPILGVIGRSLTMEDTDDSLGSPTTAYPTNRFNRELEFQTRGNYDYFQIQPDGHTLFLRVECTTDIDQIRVVTAIPEPRTFALAISMLYMLVPNRHASRRHQPKAAGLA